MNKLTKADLDERQNIIDTLRNSESGILDAYAALENAITAYNEDLDTARGWADEVATRIEEYQGERSDKWQESDAGQAHAEWLAEFQNVDFEDLEMPDEPETGHADMIESLPDGV